MLISSITHEKALRLFRYDEETGDLYWRVKGARNIVEGSLVGGICPQGYRRVMHQKKSYAVHRLIWLMVHGEWPEQIDHINGIRDDNRLRNLRLADSVINGQNRKISNHNTSGIHGVSFHRPRGTWRARINVNGRRITLGYFTTKAEAVVKRKMAEILHGYHPNHGRVA